MSSLFRVAVCSLNQLALDFDGNLQRIIRSIEVSREQGACIRIGPELEISGYSCEDAFFEKDTSYHSYQVLARILQHNFKDILIDVGMSLIKDSCLYNCRVLLLNGKIVLFRPKTKLAGNGNYREERWFTAWSGEKTKWIDVPSFITDITHQKKVPFGSDVVLNLKSGDFEFRVGYEICEELWRPDSTHLQLFLERGVHLVCNSSGSYWEIRKLDFAFDLLKTATARIGCAYAFSNLVGCDGSRICFSGRSLISMNGELLARTTDKSEIFNEVQVVAADIDVQSIDSMRALWYVRPQPHLGVGDVIIFDSKKGYQDCNMTPCLEKLTIELNIHRHKNNSTITRPVKEIRMRASEEILYYGSLWLWDYLKRCPAAGGFIIPLSGGADSSSVACLVYGMCSIAWNHLQEDKNITPRIRKLFDFKGNISEKYSGPKDLCRKILRCVYLKTKFSGSESEERARELAELLGAEYKSHNINPVYELMLESADPPVNGNEVTLREQNLQARIRMLHTYFFAGDRLVLSTGNVDEALVGYLTKYDCSSGDLNPIGGISKKDLKKFLIYCEQLFFEDSQVMQNIINATPSAELTGSEQSDEADLGLTYEELSLFGRFRKGKFGACGPYSMFCQLWEKRHEYHNITDPELLASKVKQFFRLHAKNRHKSTVLTPSLYAETYSPDDNRFDHRQFLFNADWTWQFEEIDRKLSEINK